MQRLVKCSDPKIMQFYRAACFNYLGYCNTLEVEKVELELWLVRISQRRIGQRRGLVRTSLIQGCGECGAYVIEPVFASFRILIVSEDDQIGIVEDVLWDESRFIERGVKLNGIAPRHHQMTTRCEPLVLPSNNS